MEMAGQAQNVVDGTAQMDDNDQYLTFILAEEEYGVDILCVQEIRGWENATPLPNSPPHVKGVINLRGSIVPLIDLRLCFNMPATEYSALTVVIVMRVQTGDETRIVGIIADAVSDVYSIEPGEMRPAPDLGQSVNTDFIKSIVSVDNKMVMLLEIDRLLNFDSNQIEQVLAPEQAETEDNPPLAQSNDATSDSQTDDQDDASQQAQA